MSGMKVKRGPQASAPGVSDEFKAGAVRLVLDEGKTCAQIARDLDVSPNSLWTWVSHARADRPNGKTGLASEKRTERCLRKEDRELRMERDIVKQAAAFVAKENA